MKYVIDPYLFSFDENMTPEQTNQYVGQFVELKCWWDAHHEDIYMLKDSNEMLWEGNFFPLAEKLKPLLDECDEAIEYKDISRTMNLYLGKSKTIEDLEAGNVIFWVTCSLSDRTIQLIKERPVVFRESIRDIIWNIMRICRDKVGDSANEFAVFTRGIDETLQAEFVYEFLDNGTLRYVKERGKVKTNCHSSISAFQHHEKTPFFLFKYQQSKDDLYLGVWCKVLQDGKMEDMEELDGRFRFSIQDSFYKDFCDNGYSGKPSDIRSTLDSMSKTVLGIRHGKEHNIRTGKGGNDPYLFHGEYTAMRKNVTTSIKLHFWKKPPHYIFAKIGEHDFFTIPWEEKRSVR